jgi:hypothetical protein
MAGLFSRVPQGHSGRLQFSLEREGRQWSRQMKTLSMVVFQKMSITFCQKDVYVRNRVKIKKVGKIPITGIFGWKDHIIWWFSLYFEQSLWCSCPRHVSQEFNGFRV